MSILLSTDLPFPIFRRGKVRDVYDLGNRLLIVATDRISAFDCVMPEGIPDKGRILTAVAAYWFAATQDLVPNHFRGDPEWPAELGPFHEALAGRAVVVEKTSPLPVECVVRGYLAGSGWKEYQAGGAVCGVPLPPGLRLADRLPEPIFTPATKAEEGHDENIPFERMAEIVGGEQATRLRDLSLALYRRGSELAAGRGILLADTKFEFGLSSAGELILIDEAGQLGAGEEPAQPRQAVPPGLPGDPGRLGQTAPGPAPARRGRRRRPGKVPGSGSAVRRDDLKRPPEAVPG